MFLSILISVFFSVYPEDCQETIKFLVENKSTIRKELSNLSDEDKIIALSLVAPELSQFSHIFNELEIQTLYLFYLNSGKSDFSVGYFQMKPSFIEEIEKYIRADKYLNRVYRDLLPSGSQRDKRRFRLKHLASLKGQLQYLSLFIDICKLKTVRINFTDIKDKIKYWATLYNSGLKLNSGEVIIQQNKKQFPHFTKEFNYSDVSLEFYETIKDLFW